MVKVTLHYHGSSFAEMTADGHAHSGEEGHDLVCAAISSIIFGGLNALADGDHNYEAEADKKGHIRLRSLKTPSPHDAIVLETIAKQIESLASSHPENVKLERKNDK